MTRKPNQILSPHEELPLVDKGAFTHEQQPSKPTCLVLVPGYTKTTQVFQIFEVDAEELSMFLPLKTVKKTNNFYAAQTFIEGWHAREKS